jgi:hypothetical protein
VSYAHVDMACQVKSKLTTKCSYHQI